jgi:DNA-binding GntR family transcriptional regulator
MDEVETEEFSTRTEAAYARLREEILQGVLRPGAKLRLEMLRNEYGFGLSSLREALSKLSSERLVRTTGQRGYWVESISREEFEDITKMRLFLEPEALSRSIANATLDWETEVVAAYHRLKRVEETLDNDPGRRSGVWEKENRSFHHALIRNCGSAWMMRFVETLSEQSERYRRQAVALKAVPKEKLMAEHQALFDAAIDRNPGLAAELLRVHIKNSAKGLSQALFAPTPDKAAG